jgi:hypothetical protein
MVVKTLLINNNPRCVTVFLISCNVDSELAIRFFRPSLTSFRQRKFPIFVPLINNIRFTIFPIIRSLRRRQRLAFILKTYITSPLLECLQSLRRALEAYMFVREHGFLFVNRYIKRVFAVSWIFGGIVDFAGNNTLYRASQSRLILQSKGSCKVCLGVVELKIGVR